jgi:hypothetical protein
MILHPARANRLFEHHSRDARLPSLESVIDRLLVTSIKSAPKNGYEGAVQMAIDYAMFSNLAKLALSNDAAPPAKAIAWAKLNQLKTWLSVRPGVNEEWSAFYAYLVNLTTRLADDPEEFKAQQVLQPPPGQPIGDMDLDFCNFANR